MDNTIKIKEFKTEFLDQIKDSLRIDSYEYKLGTELVFSKKEGDNNYIIQIQFYKRKTFIEIETNSFYQKSDIVDYLKTNYSNYQQLPICGGSTKFICEYYFKKNYNHKYSNLLYYFDSPIQDVTSLWIENYKKIIQVYFQECSQIKNLNKIVNLDNIYTTGMNLTYKNRIYNSIIIAKEANYCKEELLQLIHSYEEYLSLKKLPFKIDFETIVDKEIYKK